MAPKPQRSKYRSRQGQLAERYGIRMDQVPRFLELSEEIYRNLVRSGVPNASKALARGIAVRLIKNENE